jgi:membrane-bound serine protease (ClpP class)
MPRFSIFMMGVLLTAALDPAKGQDILVYRLSLTTSIDTDVVRVIDRAIQAAERRGSALVLDFGVSGGDYQTANEAVQMLGEAAIPTHAFVCDRALGVSAMLALAADSVFMCPDAVLGGADGVAAEEVSAYGAHLQRLMTARRLDRNVGLAMADGSVQISGLAPGRGGPLILDAVLASQMGVTAATVQNFDSLLALLELDEAQVIDADHDWNGTRAEIRNYNWGDVRVYVLRSGTRMRLGTVTSMNSSDFEIADGQLGIGSQIQLLAEVIGSSERFLSQQVQVQPGLVLHLDVANVIQQSAFSYYRRN